jgi:hypothetical protein
MNPAIPVMRYVAIEISMITNYADGGYQGENGGNGKDTECK